ncbi:MAG: hypothetical protein IKG23_09245 [Clostridia bacterium]|nr:hypothetical protein [Clostridia bacterium]
MNSCCKRGLPVILCLIFLLSAFAAYADSYWKMHWKPGENIISFTPEEDAQITAVIEEANQKSEGTNIRVGADRESDVETAYNNFLVMSPDGSPMEPADDKEYEDVGRYMWAVGLPDEQSISRNEAWIIMLKYLLDQGISTPEILVHYYPLVSYETGNYNGNPVWRILLECYDYQDSGLPVTAWEVAIYAHDGSICGYRDINPVG